MKTVSITAATPARALAGAQRRLGEHAVVLEIRHHRARGWKSLLPGGKSVEIVAGVPDESTGTAPGMLLNATTPLMVHDGGAHLFIGPAGVGKTTLLCKFLAREMLSNGRRPCVCRLDCWTANPAPLLDVQCEMLGIPIVHSLEDDARRGDMILVDLPGFDPGNNFHLEEFRSILERISHPQLHLVLNGAYEEKVLQRQGAAFGALGCDDVSFTHLDEAEDPQKMLAVALGINCPVWLLGGGQKIPGNLHEFRAPAARAV